MKVRVNSVSTVMVNNFYAPIVKSGTISVGGMIASNYVDYSVGNWLMHLATAPMRYIPSLLQHVPREELVHVMIRS